MQFKSVTANEHDESSSRKGKHMCYYVHRLRAEVEKKDVLWPLTAAPRRRLGPARLQYLPPGIFYAHFYILHHAARTLQERCKNILRTETLSKHYNIISLPPCCPFTEVISLRPRNDAASRSGEERSYDRQLVDCNCTLS